MFILPVRSICLYIYICRGIFYLEHKKTRGVCELIIITLSRKEHGDTSTLHVSHALVSQKHSSTLNKWLHFLYSLPILCVKLLGSGWLWKTLLTWTLRTATLHRERFSTTRFSSLHTCAVKYSPTAIERSWTVTRNGFWRKGFALKLWIWQIRKVTSAGSNISNTSDSGWSAFPSMITDATETRMYLK